VGRSRNLISCDIKREKITDSSQGSNLGKKTFHFGLEHDRHRAIPEPEARNATELLGLLAFSGPKKGERN
jgi:hypothetical protein